MKNLFISYLLLFIYLLRNNEQQEHLISILMQLKNE